MPQDCTRLTVDGQIQIRFEFQRMGGSHLWGKPVPDRVADEYENPSYFGLD